jgi:hypothetical protein
MQLKSMIMWLVVLGIYPIRADVHFGNKKSGFVVNAEATLDLGVESSLQGGRIRNDGGLVHALTLDCTDMTFENSTEEGSHYSIVNGTISMGADEADGIILTNGDSLVVAHQTITKPVTAESGVCLLQGSGSFDYDIAVASGATLKLDWNGVLSTNVLLTSLEGEASSILELKRDLHVGAGYRIQASNGGFFPNKINFNGHRLLLGGDESPAGLLFAMQWSHAHVQLHGPVETTECILFLQDGPTYIHGGGHLYIVNEYGVFVNQARILDEEGEETDLYYPVTFEDITFRNVWCALFQGGDYWNFINTTCESGMTSITINGTLLGSSPSPLSGETHFGLSRIDLNTDLTDSGGEWIFEENGSIEGSGNCIDGSEWHFSVATNKELVIRNATFKNVTSETLLGDGTLRLSHVTFELDTDDVDWSNGPLLLVDGPVTFITGSATVTVRTGSAITHATVYCDTGGAGYGDNIIGFDETAGRVKYVDVATGSPVQLFITENTLMNQDERLYPRIAGAVARTLTFVQSDEEIVYRGMGHRIILPFMTDDLFAWGGSPHAIFVGQGEDSTTVIMEDVTLQGFKSSFFSYNVSGSALYFGHNTTVVLQEDLVGDAALARNIIFGSGIAEQVESMCLDLQQHTLDCSENSIVLQGDTDSVVLRIKNGRLLNPSLVNTSSKVILDSVDLVLSGDISFDGAALDIEGCCTISGSTHSVLRWISSGNFTIRAGATLRLLDGITFFHDNSGIDNFVMEHATSTLELIGAQFERKSFESDQPSLILKTGQLIIDHQSHINVGTHGVQLGTTHEEDDLTIHIRPGATLHIVGTGSLVYSNTY